MITITVLRKKVSLYGFDPITSMSDVKDAWYPFINDWNLTHVCKLNDFGHDNFMIHAVKRSHEVFNANVVQELIVSINDNITVYEDGHEVMRWDKTMIDSDDCKLLFKMFHQDLQARVRIDRL